MSLTEVFKKLSDNCRVTPVSGSETVVFRRLANSSLEKSSSSKKIDFSIVFNYNRS